MTVPDEAVEAAAKVLWYSKKYADWDKVPQYRKEPFLNQARRALEAAAPFIAAQALGRAADNLEIRMDQSDPGSYAEQQYQAGYADAVARLILHAEGKA